MTAKADLWSQVTLLAKIVDETAKFGNANTPNALGMLQAVQAAFYGNHIGTTQSAMTGYRNYINSAIKSGSSMLSTLLIELAKTGYGSTATTVSAALDDIAAGMDALSETVKNRAYTYDTVAAGGSNTGTGNLYRNTTDVYGNSIEEGYVNAGDIKVLVTKDKWAGKTLGNEEASIKGDGTLPTDDIELGTCTNESKTLIAVRSEDSLVTNSSFNETTGSGGTFAVTDWTLSASADFQADGTNYYRAAASGTPYALEFLASGNISRYITSITIDPKLPVFGILRYRRKSSCDGSLTLRLGTKTVAIADLTSKTDATWFDLCFGLDTDGWYDNFKENYSGNNGIRLSATLASRTTGTLVIDDFILAQPTKFDGKFYMLVAGPVDFIAGDNWIYDDTVANTGRTQLTIARLFNKHLPHTSGSPTYADA